MIDDVNSPIVVGTGFDCAKVPKVLNVSTEYHAILGGVFPNHFIPIDSMDEEQIKSILAADSDIVRANEAKSVVLTFQKRKPGMHCFVTMVGQT